MTGLVIQLLGPPRLVRADSVPEPGGFDRAHLLLYFLAAHLGDVLRRERLVELFWEGMSPEAARCNLRQALHRLRRILGDEGAACLETTRDAVCLLKGGGITTDLEELSRMDGASPDPGRSARLCRGEFLEGLPLSGRLPNYEAWVESRRRELAQQQQERLGRGVGCRVAVLQLDLVWDCDAEELGAALETELPAMEAILARFGAHVVAFPGGGFTAYFGYPRPRDGVATEAVAAARAVLERSGVRLRAGIHSGLMAVEAGNVWSEPLDTISADAFDLARRAAPGEIRLSAVVARQLDGGSRLAPCDGGDGDQRIVKESRFSDDPGNESGRREPSANQ